MEHIQDFIADVSSNPYNVLIPAGLFFLFSPANFLIIPGSTSWLEWSIVAQNRTVVITHAILFGLVLHALKRKYPQYI